MKLKFAVLFVISLAIGGSLRAQDFVQNYGFVNTGTSPATPSFANTGVTSFFISWSPTVTLSTCSVQADSSSDGASWGNGDLIASQSCTTTGSSAVATIAGGKLYVRVHVTSFSGNGSLNVTLKGWGGGGSGGGSSAFSALTSGTNTTAAMVCGTGCSLTTSGSGTNTATTAATITGSLALANTPLTTTQDILYDNAGSLARLPIVTSGNCLGNTGGAWASITCGAPSFSAITGGTNTNALVVGTGGSLTTSGTGTNTATNLSSGHVVASALACVAASGSGTTYTCTTSPTFVPADGDAILFEADVANTGAMTLNVNASSAAPVKKQGGGTALVANDFLAGQDNFLIFDGVNWQMQGQIGNAAGGGLPAGLTFTSPTLTVSSAGNGSGCVALSGNSSGAPTLCAYPTGSVGIVASVPLLGVSGAVGSPTFTNGNAGNEGLYFPSTSSVGISASGTQIASFATASGVSVLSLSTLSNCASAATPAVCGSAPAGSVAVPTGATPTLTINTTAVTANSEIMLTVTEAPTTGTRLGVTCNTTLSTLVNPVETARVAGTSFTIQMNSTLAVNPACVHYTVIN